MRQNRLQRATHRAARAQNEDALALEAEPRIDRQITHQPGAVGVVTQHTAIGQFAQGVDRASPLRTSAQLMGKAVGLLFEGHGDICPASLCEKRGGATRKIIQRRQQGVVLHGLPGLLGKQTVQHRRFAVGDRVTKNDVTVHQANSSGNVRRWPASLGLAGSSQSDALPGCQARLSSRSPSAPVAATTSGSTRYGPRTAGRTRCHDRRPD